MRYIVYSRQKHQGGWRMLISILAAIVWAIATLLATAVLPLVLPLWTLRLKSQ